MNQYLFKHFDGVSFADGAYVAFARGGALSLEQITARLRAFLCSAGFDKRRRDVRVAKSCAPLSGCNAGLEG